MKINKTNFKFSSLTKRGDTKYIVLHHRAGDGDAISIHKEHLNLSYSGIGYHFYIRKNGQVYSGRPVDMTGAHAKGYNSSSVGICFEGNFENEKVSDEQKISGRELIKNLKEKYPMAKVVCHRDLNPTLCPGKNFEKGDFMTEELTSVNDIVWELSHRNIITDKALWLKKLEEDTDSYWLARKCLNYIRGIQGER